MVFEPYGGGSLDQSRAGRKPVVKHASKLAVGSAGTQVKSRFGASFQLVQKITFSSLGYGPQTQSVLRPAPGKHEQGGSWQCRNAGKVKVWSQFLVGSESNVQQSGLRATGPIRPSLPWCFSPATRSLDSSLNRSCAERKPAPGGHEQSGSQQYRNAGKVKVWSQFLVGSESNWSYFLFYKVNKVNAWSQFLVGSESNIQQSGLRAAGPIRPSLPWCFSPATRSLDSSLDRSCAERKPAPGGHEQGGSSKTQVMSRFGAIFQSVQKVTFGSLA